LKTVVKKTLANTRARFQRLSDAKLFSGWVRTFDNDSIIVVSNNDTQCKPGDEFVFQVYGPGKVFLFRGLLEAQYGRELSLKVSSTVQQTAAKEEMRLLTDGVSGTLIGEGQEVEVMVLDISAGGAGVVTAFYLSKDTPVELHLASPAGPIAVKGEVKNCREAEGMRSQYRVGISITPVTRIDSARWNQMLELDAA
jgi:hypothetical protein